MRIGIAVLILTLASAPAFAAIASVKNLRIWNAPDRTQLVFDVSRPVEHKISLLKDPYRLVVDFRDARLAHRLPAVDTGGAVLAGVRASPHGKGLRVVIDLKTDIVPHSFNLQPAGQYGHRIVLDLLRTTVVPDQPDAPLQPPKTQTPDLVVAIDAGHGGEDPGATGYRHTHEKDVVLSIARELKRQIDATPGMRAFLVRDGDYYISLRGRIEKAARQHPDVFLSVHADAVPGRRRAQGSSIYVLSERGATREAAYLAQHENAADLIGGARLDDKDNVLTKVILDMTQTGTMSASVDLGHDMLSALRRVGPLHMPHLGHAAFYVLRSHEVPSILIETAFISNPADEKKLIDKAFQRKLASGIVQGLQRAMPRLLARRVPEATPKVDPVPNAVTSAAREPAIAPEVGIKKELRPTHHIVQAGERLSDIAERYGVNVDALRFLNNLSGNEPAVGAELEIPPRGGAS